MMRRFFVGVLAILALVGLGVFVAQYGPFGEKAKKSELIQSLFAPQMAQANALSVQLETQFEARAAQKGLTDVEKAVGTQALEENKQAMLAVLETVFSEAYTLAQLREKKAFEASTLAENLRESERQILQLMHVVGKALGRQAILKSVEKEFPQAAVSGLKEAVEAFLDDTKTPDVERAKALAKQMDVDAPQAHVLMVLLSVRQQDVVHELAVLGYDKKIITDEQLKRAKIYMELTQINKVFDDTVLQMVEEAALEDEYAQARQQIAYGVANTYAPEVLTEANAYFSKEIAQEVLQKDIYIARQISPQITELLKGVNKTLTEVLAKNKG